MRNKPLREGKGGIKVTRKQAHSTLPETSRGEEEEERGGHSDSLARCHHSWRQRPHRGQPRPQGMVTGAVSSPDGKSRRSSLPPPRPNLPLAAALPPRPVGQIILRTPPTLHSTPTPLRANVAPCRLIPPRSPSVDERRGASSVLGTDTM